MLFADLALRPEAKELISHYQSTTTPKAIFHRTDVTSWADLTSMFAAATTHFGSIDIVCPGAGVFEPPFSSFWHPPGSSSSKDSPTGDRYALLDINVTHVVRTTQLAIQHFINASPPASPQNPKTVVIVASIAGEVGSLPFPLYHTSKFAVVGLTRALADLEGLVGVRVAAVAPGIVRTPLWLENPDKLRFLKQEGDEEGERDAWVTPEEVATVMLRICDADEVGTSVDAGKKGDVIKIGGGSVLEVAAGVVRDVPMLGNTGPSGIKGNTVSNAAEAYGEIIGMLKKGWGE